MKDESIGTNVEEYGEQTTVVVGEQNPLFDDAMVVSPSNTPALEISSETATSENTIIFDMATPEVSNEQISVEESLSPITDQTPIESVSSENTLEISQLPIDSLATAEPIRMDLPEIKSDTVQLNQTVTQNDPLDIFSGGIQNNEININEDIQPKPATDDLGFLDAFG